MGSKKTTMEGLFVKLEKEKSKSKKQKILEFILMFIHPFQFEKKTKQQCVFQILEWEMTNEMQVEKLKKNVINLKYPT